MHSTQNRSVELSRAWIGLVLALSLVLTDPLSAQTAGNTIPQSDDVPFATTGQSIWAPTGVDPDALAKYWLFNDVWNESDSHSGITTLPTIFGDQKFGGSIGGSSSGRTGMNFSVSGLGDGSIGVDYPVVVTIDVPEANSFRPGEPVTIPTSWEVGDDGDFDAEMEPVVMSIGGAFGYGASADFKLCVFSCSDKTNFFPPISIPESEFEMLRIGDPSWVLDDNAGQHTLNAFFALGELITGVDGFVQRPEPFDGKDITSSGSKLELDGSGDFFGMSMDIDAFLFFTGGVPWYISLGEDIDLTRFDVDVTVGYNLADLRTEMVFSQKDAIEFDARPTIHVDLGRSIQWWVTDPDTNTEYASGTSSSAVFPAGMDLTVIVPSVTPVVPSTAYTLPNTFSHESHLEVSGDFEHSDLSLDIVLPGHSFSQSRREDHGRNVWNSCDDLDDLSDVWDCFTGAISGWYSWVSNWVTQIYNYAFQAKDVELGPVYQTNFADWGTSVELVDASWSLDGFGQLGGSPFTLDPENPIIALSTDVANSLLSTGADPGTVTQTLLVENLGDVKLSLTQITEAITAEAGASGYTVVRVTSFELTPGGFDGGADQTMLGGSDMLGVGATGTVQVVLAPEAGHVFSASALVDATSPIGTGVSDAAGTSFAIYPLEFKKDHITRPSTKSKSAKSAKSDKSTKLKVRVYTSPDLDVHRIDLGSLALEGAAPVKTKFRDGRGGDDDDDRRRPFVPYLEVDFLQVEVLAGLDARLGTAPALLIAQRTDLVDAVRKTTPDLTPIPLNRLISLVLSAGRREADELKSIDRFGNGNGRVDIGDLRAQIIGSEVSSVELQASAKGGKSNKVKPDESAKSAKSEKSVKRPKGPIHILVLSGTLDDGTPFWAEDSLEIRGGGK